MGLIEGVNDSNTTDSGPFKRTKLKIKDALIEEDDEGEETNEKTKLTSNEKITFIELAEKILKLRKKPMSSEEIWDMVEEKGYDKYIFSEGKTPWATIGAVIYKDMMKNKNSIFGETDSKPKKFYIISNKKMSEKDLITPKVDTESKKRNGGISISKRALLWRKYYPNSLDGVCVACRQRNISIDNFDAGHVISRNEGGSDNIDNLRPICRPCNLAMGTMDMDKYIETNFGSQHKEVNIPKRVDKKDLKSSDKNKGSLLHESDKRKALELLGIILKE